MEEKHKQNGEGGNNLFGHLCSVSLGSCVCLENLESIVSVFYMCGKEERAFMQGERVWLGERVQL